MNVLLLLDERMHFLFYLNQLFLCSFLGLLRAYLFSNLAEQDFFEDLAATFTLALEFSQARNSILLRFFQLLSGHVELNHPIVSFYILWVVVEACPVVELSLVYLIALEVAQGQISVQLSLQRIYLFKLGLDGSSQ